MTQISNALPTGYQTYIHKSRYARYVDEYGRREHWPETITRYLDHMAYQYKIHNGEEIPKETYDELWWAIYNLEIMPSMRALMTAGKALERDNVAGYNCSYLTISGEGETVTLNHPKLDDPVDVHISNPIDFDEMMYILMAGTGVGFSEERQFTNNLPKVGKKLNRRIYERRQENYPGIPKNELSYIDRKNNKIIVQDSKYGWSSALRVLVVELFNGNYEISWDLSNLREAGARLNTFGGRSCLTGDTIVYRDRKKSRGYNEITLHELYQMKHSEGFWSDKPNHFNKVKLRSLDEDGGVFYRNQLLDVIDNGEAPVYTIVTENGYRIRATDNHRFMDSTGNWRFVSDFVEGQEIAVGDAYSHKYLSYDKIVSIQYDGVEQVYDLQMESPDNNFVANGFVSHNSGPEPLNELFEFIQNIFSNADGRKLTSLEVHDICCKIASIVVSGGVRRSALLALSNLSDDRMKKAKSGNWWEHNIQRALSNNSVAYTERPQMNIFLEEFKNLVESGSGERGIFNREAAQKKISKIGRRDPNYDFGCNPCSEILLRPKEFCNLTEVVVRPDDTKETLKHKARLATILGTLQATLTNFVYLSKKWKENCEEERLLGVSLTGIMDNKMTAGLSVKHDELKDTLDELREHTIEVNQEWADELGINRSAAITCVKPSGTVSQMVDAASGIHPRYSKYYIRRVRADKKDPLAEMMIENGFPYEEDFYSSNNWVFEFPIEVPDDSVVRDQFNALDQLELWKIYNDHWCEHKPSITVYVQDHEWLQVGSWVYDNFDSMSGISFLPHTDHTYKQAPYEEIDQETYQRLVEEMPDDIDWEDLKRFEGDDHTEGSQELACTGGACEIV